MGQPTLCYPQHRLCLVPALLISSDQLRDASAMRPTPDLPRHGAAKNGGSWPLLEWLAPPQSRRSSGFAMPLEWGAGFGQPPARGRPLGSVRRASEPVVSALDSQTFPTLGAACGDDGAAAAGLHAHQKSVGAGAAGLRGLVRSFHGGAWAVRGRESGKPVITAKMSLPVNDLPHKDWAWAGLDVGAGTVDNHVWPNRCGLQSGRSTRTCPQ